MSTTVLPADVENECFAENGDHALSTLHLGVWSISRAKCSCLASLPGSDGSTFDMLVVKATPDQKVPRLSVMVSATREFAENVDYFPVTIDGKTVPAGAQPKAGVFVVELEGAIDWFRDVSQAHTIQIGPYTYTSDQSATAMSGLLNCYGDLKGN
jgi:hypothetical protein